MDEQQRAFNAPGVSAIYFWMYDFSQLLGLNEEQAEERLRRFSRERGRHIRPDKDPFLDAYWRARRPALQPRRLTVLSQQLAAETNAGREAAILATYFQRPLYVGITSNFGRRVAEHMDRPNELASRLECISVRECCVLWQRPPQDLIAESAPSVGGSDREGEMSELEGDERQGILDETLRDIHSVADPDLLPLTAASVESLLIRTTAPLFNVRHDSPDISSGGS